MPTWYVNIRAHRQSPHLRTHRITADQLETAIAMAKAEGRALGDPDPRIISCGPWFDDERD